LEFKKKSDSKINYDIALEIDGKVMAKLNNDTSITVWDKVNYLKRATMSPLELCECICTGDITKNCLDH